MNMVNVMTNRPKTLAIAAILAIVFGLLTIVSGGRALFDGADMGNVVLFVLRFNFIAGFAYVAAGVAIWRGANWGTLLALIIVVVTAVVFAAFLWHVRQGGAYEMRTMGAMIIRLLVWVAVATLAIRVKYRVRG